MTTLDNLLDRVPVEQISRESREVDVGRLVLAVLAAVLVFIGRSAGWLVTALVWSVVAVRVGYRQARPKPTVSPPGR